MQTVSSRKQISLVFCHSIQILFLSKYQACKIDSNTKINFVTDTTLD